MAATSYPPPFEEYDYEECLLVFYEPNSDMIGGISIVIKIDGRDALVGYRLFRSEWPDEEGEQ